MKFNRNYLTFIPLLVYFIADMFLSPIVSLIIAISLIFIELGFSWIKRKGGYTALFIELVLILILSAGDFWSDEMAGLNYLLGSVGFSFLFFYNLFIDKGLIIGMLKRYNPNHRFNAFQRYQLTATLRFIFWYLLALTMLLLLMVIIKAQHNIIPLYILVGWLMVLIPSLIIRNRLIASRYAKESWVPILTDDFMVEGVAPRSVVHDRTFILHPVVHLHLINDGKIYLQKRPLHKKIQPGKWDTAVGGHVDEGEEMLQALLRETKEELGIVLQDFFLLKQYVWQSRIENELVFSFCAYWDKEINPDENELDGGAFWTIEDIESNASKSIFTDNFLYELPWLKSLITKDLEATPETER